MRLIPGKCSRLEVGEEGRLGMTSRTVSGLREKQKVENEEKAAPGGGTVRMVE